MEEPVRLRSLFRRRGPGANASASGGKRAVRAVNSVLFATLLSACAHDTEILTPSQAIAMADRLDGKHVRVRGWVEVLAARCIWDSKEDFDRGLNDADTVLKHSLSIFDMPNSTARNLANRTGDIEGTFFIDVAQGRVSDGMCNSRGIDMGSPVPNQ